MSIERVCKCGKEESIRYNFGGNWEAEKEFHSHEYVCDECFNKNKLKKFNTLDEILFELENDALKNSIDELIDNFIKKLINERDQTITEYQMELIKVKFFESLARECEIYSEEIKNNL